MKENISNLPGIYIHIPFCEKKCGYCDFYSITDLSARETFVAQLISEIKLTCDGLDDTEKIFDTIYLGGGTPSLLTVKDIDLILNTLRTSLQISEDCEITIEVNPGTMEKGLLEAYRSCGINRLSIGIQSFYDTELRALERIHTAQQARDTFNKARSAGFDNISIDLISALPGQTIHNWHSNLEQALELNPEHISAYNLTFEKGTPFYERLIKGELLATTDDQAVQFLLKTNDMLGEAGYQAYEISNYARDPGRISRHNYKYWIHVPYLGFGPSAHSYYGERRFGNYATLEHYIKSLEAGKLPRDFTEIITNRELKEETIMLSLRTNRGLDLKEYKKCFSEDFRLKHASFLNSLEKQKLILLDKDYLCFTTKGMLICDELIARFI